MGVDISPSEAQLDYARKLKILIPDGATKKDVSALISRKEDYDSAPNTDLLQFAIDRGIHVYSLYIGKKALYNLIWHELKDEDQVEFFIFCIYRHLSNDRAANLDKHQHKESFRKIANKLYLDKKFVTSMKKYGGDELRFFGKIKFDDGNFATGGSESTIAYKCVADVISKQFSTPITRAHKFKSDTPKFQPTEKKVVICPSCNSLNTTFTSKGKAIKFGLWILFISFILSFIPIVGVAILIGGVCWFGYMIYLSTKIKASYFTCLKCKHVWK